MPKTSSKKTQPRKIILIALGVLIIAVLGLKNIQPSAAMINTPRAIKIIDGKVVDTEKVVNPTTESEKEHHKS
jgi:hypothetical protein